jgi:hypothetical protein
MDYIKGYLYSDQKESYVEKRFEYLNENLPELHSFDYNSENGYVNWINWYSFIKEKIYYKDYASFLQLDYVRKRLNYLAKISFGDARDYYNMLLDVYSIDEQRTMYKFLSRSE